MAYLGRELQYGSFIKQTLSADSSTTVFTLDQGVGDANNLLVSISGVIQEPNVAYTASDTVITFTSAPTVNPFITFLGIEATSGTGVSRSDISYETLMSTGASSITLGTSVLQSDAIRVSFNGVVQKPETDYTVSGTTLSFVEAPANNQRILVYHLASEKLISSISNTSITQPKMSLTGVMPAWNGSNLTNIPTLSSTQFDNLNANLSLIGFRRSTHYGTSSLDLPNGFIDQFEDQTNVNDDNSVGETYDATNDYYTNKVPLDSNSLLMISSDTTNGSTTFTDSANGYVVTASGDAQHSTTEKKFGATSIKFDGNGDYLTIPDNSVFQFAGNYTIECWFNTSSSSGGCFYSRHSSHAHFLGINRATAGAIRWQDDKNGIYLETGSGLNDGAWHHIALVRNGSGSNNLKLYIDGTLSSTQSGSTAQNFASDVAIGYYIQANNHYLDGYIDEFRISDTARYTANFTPSTTGFNPSPENMTLVSESDTAAASTDKAYTTLFLHDKEPDTPDTRPQIPQSTGTIIASIGTGPSAAGKLWDGDRTSGESGTGSNDYTGKDWGNGVTKIVTGFKVWNHENTHGMNVGGATIEGILQGSQDGSNWTQLATSGTVNDGQGQPTPYLAMDVMSGVTATTAYRYHRVLFQGYSTDIRWGEIEFYQTVAGSAGAVITPNTDIMAWASRSSKTVTATNATNLLTANGHGLSNNDRVILTTSASDLPNGLTETAYYVVSSTTNTFQVSASSGGAAITFSDDGTGTHTVHAVTQAPLADKGDYGTGQMILSGTADISGQPAGTDMRLIVQTKNAKHTRLHGMALQYS